MTVEALAEAIIAHGWAHGPYTIRTCACGAKVVRFTALRVDITPRMLALDPLRALYHAALGLGRSAEFEAAHPALAGRWLGSEMRHSA